MKLVKLKKIAKITSGSTAPKDKEFSIEGYPFIRVSHLDDLISESYPLDMPKITIEIANKRKMKLSEKESIVFAKSGMSCLKNRVLKLKEDSYIVNHLACVKVFSELVSVDYLRYYFVWFKPSKLVIDESYPSIRLSDIGELNIPVPPLETQKKIVEVLDKAQGLIDARKEQIRLMDELIQSVFYEMFADPVTNPKGWEVVKMSSLGSFKNGMNYSSSDSGVSINCLGVGDFKSLYKIEQTEVLPMISLNQIPSEDYMLRNKDIVFVRSNGNKALVGRSVIVFPDNNKVTFSGFCIRLRVTSDIIHEEFLIQLLRITSVKNKLLSNGRGANISNLNQKMLSDVDVILPPKELQIRFIEIVEKIENQKEYMELSLSEHEMNFQSIVKASF